MEPAADFWQAVTEVDCPACCGGRVQWHEAGFVPGYRTCTNCGRHYVAKGKADAPVLVEVPGRREVFIPSHTVVDGNDVLPVWHDDGRLYTADEWYAFDKADRELLDGNILFQGRGTGATLVPLEHGPMLLRWHTAPEYIGTEATTADAQQALAWARTVAAALGLTDEDREHDGTTSAALVWTAPEDDEPEDISERVWHFWCAAMTAAEAAVKIATDSQGE
jgi:hypothetical protein